MTLDELLQPGRAVRLFYGERNVNNRLMHIRAIVDGRIVVYRSWGKRKQRWHYGTERISYLELAHGHGWVLNGGKSAQAAHEQEDA